jgi:hypothetical protein
MLSPIFTGPDLCSVSIVANKDGTAGWSSCRQSGRHIISAIFTGLDCCSVSIADNRYRIAVNARCLAGKPCARLFVHYFPNAFLVVPRSEPCGRAQRKYWKYKRAERRIKLIFDDQPFESNLKHRRGLGRIRSELKLAAFDCDEFAPEIAWPLLRATCK